MKVLISLLLAGFLGTGWWLTRSHGTDSAPGEAVRLVGNSAAGPVEVQPTTRPLPPSTPLVPTPRARFTPTTRKGYWNIDVVGDFTLPANKTLTFCGAGRNLSVQQDWEKIFRRGFSSVNVGQMTPEEFQRTDRLNPNFRSRLQPSRRAIWLAGQYFGDAPFSLAWARNGRMAGQTTFRRPDNDPRRRQSLYAAAQEISGSCIVFGDCPPSGTKITWAKVFIDIENEYAATGEEQQEMVNAYAYLLKTINDNASPYTEVGIMPVPRLGFGYSRATDFDYPANWLWTMPAKHTATSRQRGMTDDVVGKSVGDLVTLQMPGTYYVYPDFDYATKHNQDGDRHWLAALLQEQEVNARLSPKKRVAYQWLFNTQSGDFPNSGKASHPAPPAIAEGVGVFYWFTGAYGAVFWDDHVTLTPDQPTPADPAQQGLGNDRNYACYEHYIHGLWRLFSHHRTLFDGQEKYLNSTTECSFDDGQTWVKYTPNQYKTHEVPFARAIVNGNQILIAATMPYAQPGQASRLKVRYLEDGYQFYTDISLKGDEIYLGRATMSRSGARKAAGR